MEITISTEGLLIATSPADSNSSPSPRGGAEGSEHWFRQCSGQIVGRLVRVFGAKRLELAEEAVQEAFRKALEQWPVSGRPANPAAWLHAVARNAALDALRGAQRAERKAEEIAQESSEAAEPRRDSSELDDRAAMLLLSCNPSLPPKSRICLALKAVCGFSVREIARALAMNEEAIKKTLARAKAAVAEDDRPFEAISRARVRDHFHEVLETIYALFTEGFAASSGESQLRKELAEEAIFLAEEMLACPLVPSDRRGELRALLALMLFQGARFDAREDATGAPLRLDEQDRSRWNQAMIQAGLVALKASLDSPRATSYHLEARIAAEHATARDFAATRWEAILALYDRLLDLKDVPAVRLGRVVAARYALGPERAMEEFAALPDAAPGDIFSRHAVRGELLQALGRAGEARAAWLAAADHAPTEAERRFAERRLAERKREI